MDTDTIIKQLEYEADKHKNDSLFTGQTDITAMCRDLIPKMKELKQYEDLKQDGRLLELPCKIGTAVFVIREFNRYGEIGDKPTVCYQIVERKFNALMTDIFGILVFLTKEAAEAALKEMEGQA